MAVLGRLGSREREQTSVFASSSCLLVGIVRVGLVATCCYTAFFSFSLGPLCDFFFLFGGGGSRTAGLCILLAFVDPSSTRPIDVCTTSGEK